MKINNLKHEANRWGGKVSGSNGQYMVAAPEGKVWIAGNTHNLKVHWDSPEERNDIIASTIRKMNAGVEHCSLKHCTFCLQLV